VARERVSVVGLSGAGISAESGINTFRDAGGLWEGYAVEEIATPDAWNRNPELVQKFYNQRRKAVLSSEPNSAHLALVELERYFDLTIITQNIDDLHERAGSSDVLHLHGQIRMAQSSLDASLIYPIEGSEIKMGQLCEHGSQLRPHVVWFGEAVPAMDRAIPIVERADILIVIGTSLVVYPAAGLLEFVSTGVDIFLSDIKQPEYRFSSSVQFFEGPATVGVRAIVDKLTARAQKV